MKPMAMILKNISIVNAIVNASSIRSAHMPVMGASGLSGGPCTASAMLLRMMTVRAVPSNHFCSTTQMNPSRIRFAGAKQQHMRESESWAVQRAALRSSVQSNWAAPRGAQWRSVVRSCVQWRLGLRSIV